MLKGNESSGIAIVVVVLFVALVGVLIGRAENYAFINEVCLSANYQTDNDKDEKPSKHASESDPDYIFSLPPLDDKHQSRCDAYTKYYHESHLVGRFFDDADDAVAWGTWAAAILAAFAVWLLRETLKATGATVKEMKDTNKAAWAAVGATERGAIEQRDIGRTAHAAFLVPANFIAEAWSSHDEKLMVSYKNIGNSPAYNVRFTGQIRVCDFINLFTPQEISSLTSFNDFLSPREESKFWLGFSRERLFKSAANANYINVSGVIIWDDIFGKARGIKFNFQSRIAEVGPIDRFYHNSTGNEVLEDWQIKRIENLNVGQTADIDEK